MEGQCVPGAPVDPEMLARWVEGFHRDGFILIHDALTPELCAQLRDDLDQALDAVGGNEVKTNAIQLKHRLFETSDANLSLFDHEPIVSFAEALIADCVHVVHNNSFKVEPGAGHGITTWHQDDAPHYLVTDGEPPKNVRLPVLLFTANYYLTDVESPEYGPTQLLPGSHLFGKRCPPTLDGTPYENETFYACARAGSVICFNNQVWHRGAPNFSGRIRYITQVSYGRRLIGHKYAPFMNYQMPEHVVAKAEGNPRLKRLLGFLPNGAYG